LNQFTIPHRLPGLNDFIAELNKRSGRYNPANILKRDTQEMIRMYAYQALNAGQLRKVSEPCEVFITWQEENKRRDVDNVESAVKFILDALIGVVIMGDSPRYVRQIHHTVVYGNCSRVTVEFKEAT
jgi:hypothetical protein